TERGSVVLSGGWRVLSVGDWVLDGARYREVRPPPNSEVLASPDGRLVAVVTTRDSDVVVDIQRPDGTHVRTLHPGDLSGFGWSPGSDRLLAEAAGAKDPFHLPGYAIVDVTTGSVTTKWPEYPDCSECRFVWTRDDTGVALALPNRLGGEDELVSSVDVFNAAPGALRQHRPITGMPAA